MFGYAGLRALSPFRTGLSLRRLGVTAQPLGDAMSQMDAAFAGSIPAIYEKNLVPMYFAPYAHDLCERLAAGAPRRILEIAAGTGAVTRLLRKRLPDATITATDLNQAMLDVAAKLVGDGIEWRQADAGDLPFPDQSFDAAACQFGVMFFPDKAKAFAEASRVLTPGGAFHFNVWDKLETCDFARVVTEAMAELYPNDPPTFFPRVPHGYCDEAQITRDLKAAGFKDINFENIEHRSISPSALTAATGLCEGTPLRSEIEARKSPTLEEATRHATEVFIGRFGRGEIAGGMQAIQVWATRA
jgi:ubiquinone/menaquinone biosynthesis C-methylase UbiE